MTTHLRGITWGHDRGFAPLDGTRKLYSDLGRGVEVTWEARSLQAFADLSIDTLAQRFDLLVIDHPFVGAIADTGSVVPLDEWIPAELLSSQREDAVGASHESYSYMGHQWAFALDAAAQVTAYRPDLMARADAALPRTWEDVLGLCDRLQEAQLTMALPTKPIDAFMCFCSLCANAGREPYDSDGVLTVDDHTVRQTLDLLRELISRAYPASTSLDPPQTLEIMAKSDAIAYVPLLFGYSNYARPGHYPNLVAFCDIPSHGSGPIGSILGGAGIAVSASSDHVAQAVEYASWLVAADIQRGAYFETGGQPARRSAWLDANVNARSANFFRDTVATVENAYLRPRCRGVITLQERAGRAINRFLAGVCGAEEVMRELRPDERQTSRGGSRGHARLAVRMERVSEPSAGRLRCSKDGAEGGC